MITFVWPSLAVLLPLPWFVRRFLSPASRIEEAALRVPFLGDFADEAATTAHDQRPARWLLLLAVIAWSLLISAAMRPQWLGELIEIPVSGRDLMMAVDLSGSMQEKDFKLGSRNVDRLTATKSIAGSFIERRIGDRLGLILFGKRAYLQVPLTFDRKTVTELLYESVIGLAGKSTAIGDAIGLAVKRLREEDENSRVLILLTDGANTAGEVDPLSAADLAAREGLKIYTIGIGADEMIVNSFFGRRRVNPSADLDEVTLQGIAEKTGGQYFRARDTKELEEIYALLDKLEPVEKESQKYRPRTALYFWPLSVALCIALFIFIAKVSNWTWRRY